VHSTDLSALIALIYDSALDAAAWPRFLDAFANATGATSAALLHHDVSDPRGAVSASIGISPESLRLYAQHFGEVDPWVATARAKGTLLPGIVHVGEELVPRSELVRTEYYNDFGRPYAMTRVLSAALRRDESVVSSVSLLRDDAHRPFHRRESALLELLIPHLQRALEVHRRLMAVELLNEGLTGALHRLPTGVLIVRADARIVLCNRAAEKTLAERDGLSHLNGKLVAASSSHDRELRRLVAGAAGTTAGRDHSSGGILALVRPSLRRPLLLMVSPLSLARVPPYEDLREMAAVFVTDMECIRAPEASILKSLWDLTPAEAEIAIGLASGASLREVAKRRGIAVETARWHLKHILEKSQASNQVELARMMAQTHYVTDRER
jgi:DNA-binding CsgD family transcriptional regulator